ncbi:MAG: DUF58 domain-containing protein [Flammeovirgaceae bacterium]
MSATKRRTHFLTTLQYYWLFIPIKWNVIVLTIAAFLGYSFITINYTKPDTIFALYLELFTWILVVFCGLIISIGIVSALFCWGYYLINRKQDKNKLLQIRIEENVITKPGYVAVSFDLPNILIPFLGFARARIVFKDKQQSEEIVLRPLSWIHWFGFKKAEKRIFLPHRQTYDIDSILLSFQDIFRLFSWPILVKKKDTFHVSPTANLSDELEVPPSKSVEMTQRIKTLRKVDGDFLNYKNFEPGDDIRRIVWKIYAKTHELVVRVPEVINPYASHIHLFSSFYKGFETPSDYHSRMLLDSYKDGVYQVYQTLKEGDMDVSYHSDQPLAETVHVDEVDPTLYSIVNSQWQTDQSPVSMPIKNKQMILCVSSLVDAEDVQALIERHSIQFIYIKCSEILDSQSVIRFQELFLKSSISWKDRLRIMAWKFSAKRRAIRKNEKALEQLLNEQIPSEID